MIRKILYTASLSGLLLVGGPAVINSAAAQTQGKQTQQSTKQVTGKVTSIGAQGKSFEVQDNSGKTLQFVLDKNTQVEGQVKTGTVVVVEYQPMDGGQNLCVRVAPQQS